MSINKNSFLREIKKGVGLVKETGRRAYGALKRYEKRRENRAFYKKNSPATLIMKRYYVDYTIPLKNGIREKRRKEIDNIVKTKGIKAAIAYTKKLKSDFDKLNYGK